MASGAHSICHGDCGRSLWRAAASHPFIFVWKRSDLETSDSFYLENWQFLPASQPPWMCCNPFLMLPTWNAVLQDKDFLAVNEFSNELSFQNSEEMPSDTLGSAKQEGNGSFCADCHKQDVVCLQSSLALSSSLSGLCTSEPPCNGLEESEVSEPISDIVSEQEVAPGEGANKIKHCILGSSVLFWGIYHSDCAAEL